VDLLGKITLKGPPRQGAVYLGCVCGRAGRELQEAGRLLDRAAGGAGACSPS